MVPLALISTLTLRDLKNRYAGSQLGVLWSFIQPIVTIFVMWAVFSFGLRIKTADSGVPYLPWLFGGTVVWNFIAEAITQSANVFVEYAYLIRKSNFRLYILPAVKILSSLGFHLVFLAMVICVSALYSQPISLKILQLPYFLVCALVLTTSLGLAISSVVVFFRDVSQLLQISLQLGFWLTPVIWEPERVPIGYRGLVLYNPAAYIVSGYRSSIFGGPWFFEDLKHTLSFWVVCGLSFLLSYIIYRRLRPHFGDVL